MTKIKKDSSLENLENQKYLELQEAQNEEDSIMDEITIVFSSVLDRKEAEKIVLDKWIPLMDKAREKTAKAMDAWHKIMEEKTSDNGEIMDVIGKSLKM